MKRRYYSLLLLLVGILPLTLAAAGYCSNAHNIPEVGQTSEIKERAYKILNTKCNVCHRTQNPFMVFTHKNMEKRAKRIHKQVFVKKRMPKGNTIKLSAGEYDTLREWLQSLNIY